MKRSRILIFDRAGISIDMEISITRRDLNVNSIA
jgi:hypothetical protein